MLIADCCTVHVLMSAGIDAVVFGSAATIKALQTVLACMYNV